MNVTISERAEKNLNQIYSFIKFKFSQSACDKFKKKLIKVVKIISENPDLFPVSDKNPLVHRCVVTKQTTLYYTVDNDEVQIITIQDTRQNLNKLKLD